MKRKLTGPIVDQLQGLITEMRSDEWSEVDMATVVTRDKNTGVMTIVAMTETGLDPSNMLFDAMAHAMLYAKVQ